MDIYDYEQCSHSVGVLLQLRLCGWNRQQELSECCSYVVEAGAWRTCSSLFLPLRYASGMSPTKNRLIQFAVTTVAVFVLLCLLNPLFWYFSDFIFAARFNIQLTTGQQLLNCSSGLSAGRSPCISEAGGKDLGLRPESAVSPASLYWREVFP
jgi:hypothetical protein